MIYVYCILKLSSKQGWICWLFRWLDSFGQVTPMADVWWEVWQSLVLMLWALWIIHKKKVYFFSGVVILLRGLLNWDTKFCRNGDLICHILLHCYFQQEDKIHDSSTHGNQCLSLSKYLIAASPGNSTANSMGILHSSQERKRNPCFSTSFRQQKLSFEVAVIWPCLVYIISLCTRQKIILLLLFFL